MLAIGLIIGGLIFCFKDKIFDTASYHKGVKIGQEIALPATEGVRYVESASSNKLLLVSIDKKQKASAIYLNLDKLKAVNAPANSSHDEKATGKPQDKGKPSTPPAQETSAGADKQTEVSDIAKQLAMVSSPVDDFPKCDLKSQPPFTLKQGKPVCNQSEVQKIKVADMTGLSKQQKVNLGEILLVAGRIDNVTVAYTDPKYAPHVLVGIGADKKLLWARVYDFPVTARVVGDKIWAVTTNKIFALMPASNKETTEINQKNSALLAEDILSLPNYKIYQAYLNLFATLTIDKFDNDILHDIPETASYSYALVKIDNSGIPALFLSQNTSGYSTGDIQDVAVYLYREKTGKLVKTDKSFIIGKRSAGGWHGNLFANGDDAGFTYMSSIGAGEKAFHIWKVKNEKIMQVKKFLSKDAVASDAYAAKQVKIVWYPVTDLDPLKKAFQVRDTAVKQFEQKVKERITGLAKETHEKVVAVAKKSGDTVLEGEIRIMKGEEIVKKFFPDRLSEFRKSSAYDSLLYKDYPVLILPTTVEVPLYTQTGGIAPSATSWAALCTPYGECGSSGIDRWYPYNGKKVTVAFSRGFKFEVDLTPIGMTPYHTDGQVIP